jgi:hypothetical protein
LGKAALAGVAADALYRAHIRGYNVSTYAPMHEKPIEYVRNFKNLLIAYPEYRLRQVGNMMGVTDTIRQRIEREKNEHKKRSQEEDQLRENRINDEYLQYLIHNYGEEKGKNFFKILKPYEPEYRDGVLYQILFDQNFEHELINMYGAKGDYVNSILKHLPNDKKEWFLRLKPPDRDRWIKIYDPWDFEDDSNMTRK